jgi:hypothetical protein
MGKFRVGQQFGRNNIDPSRNGFLGWSQSEWLKCCAVVLCEQHVDLLFQRVATKYSRLLSFILITFQRS